MSFPKRSANQKTDLYDNLQKHGCLIDTREIYLHSHPDESDPGVDFRMATTLQKNLRFLESINHEAILIHLHSEGGEWVDTLAIYDSISNCQSHITCLGYGCISSAASVIIQAADLRILTPNASMMIHYGYAGTEDNSGGFLSTAEQIKRDNRVMLEIYAQKAINGEFFHDKTHSYVKKYFDRRIKDKVHLYMTGLEAKSYGLVDAILGEDKYPNIQALLEK